MGVLLIYTGVLTVWSDDNEEDLREGYILSQLKLCLGDRLVDYYDMQHGCFFVYDSGRLCATMLVYVGSHDRTLHMSTGKNLVFNRFQ